MCKFTSVRDIDGVTIELVEGSNMKLYVGILNNTNILLRAMENAFEIVPKLLYCTNIWCSSCDQI